MSLLQNSNAVTPSGSYDIDYSMYIGDAPDSTPKLARTLNQTGSTSPKWTFATWYKKGKLTTSGKVLYYFEPKTVGAAATVDLQLTNDEVSNFIWSAWSGSSQPWVWTSSGTPGMMLRDYAGWMHITHVVDHSTSPYVWLYLNGVLVDPNIWGSKTGAGYAANYSPVSGDVFKIGSNNSNQLGSGYFADTYWIEQQALAPVGNFGEIDADTGQFVATKYAGPAMTGNSFYLNYSDSSNFGTDSSGLGNNFTATGIAATQQMIDTPQNSTGGNFCTLNPLNLGMNTASSGVLSEGNLYYASYNGTSGYNDTYGTFSLESGKWYWEVEVVNNFSDSFFGICDPSNISNTVYPMSATGAVAWNCITAAPYIRMDGSDTTYGTQTKASNGDILGIALDLDGETFEGFVNNVSQGSFNISSRTVGGGVIVPVVIGYSAGSGTSTFVLNFGQDSSFAGQKTAQGNTDGNDNGDFYYTPPSGYLGLCTNNLADPSIALPGEHYNAITYTGDGATRSLTGVGFQPDWLVVKRRDANHSWMNYDVVRGFSGGVGYRLAWNNGEVESAVANGLTSFDSDGFSVGSATGVNVNTGTYVAYNWKAGGTAVSNTDGTITSSVSANTTAGFSIVGWTGTQAVGTVGHGLSAAPELIIAKDRDSTPAWRVGSDYIPTAWEYVCYFSQTPGATDENTAFNDTAPTASLFTLGTGADINPTGDKIIAYCIHSVEGYSKVGSYTGNGNADGTFIYTGFRPAFFLCKNTAQTEGWNLWDSARMPYNKMPKQFMPDDNRAEYTANTTTFAIDFVSNGVKLRSSYSSLNNNSQNFVYWAFAESPFKTSRAR